ncbi:MAG: hypothetical protein GEU80_06690 [Dehalococcoidia bacterium]|nr:hypothetical protein [Dehalococcoidia bacterium]
MTPLTHSRLLFAVVAACCAVLASSCGGSQGASRADAEAVVGEFVEGWQLASGPQRDEAAAAAIRRLLADELTAGTDIVLDGHAVALMSTRPDLLYDQYMGLAIPHDDGYEVVETATDGDAVVVTVRLRYTTAAAGGAAAAGVIPFERVAEVHQQVAGDPIRLFTLKQVDGHWRIAAIRAPLSAVTRAGPALAAAPLPCQASPRTGSPA